MCRYAYIFHDDCQHHVVVLVEFCEKAPAMGPTFLSRQLREYTSFPSLFLLFLSLVEVSQTAQLSSPR